MRLLILASRFDPVANAVAERVTAMGGSVLRWSLEDLAAARWRHRLGEGGVHTVIVAADGTSSDAFAPEVVLNRLRYEPVLLFTRMNAVDRDYARAEFYALLLSWLASLGSSVVGRPAATGLAGPALGAWQWLAAARHAGLPPYPAMASTSARLCSIGSGPTAWPTLLAVEEGTAIDLLGLDRPVTSAPSPLEETMVTVVGDGVTGASDPSLVEPSAALAIQVGADLLQVQFARPEPGAAWHFVGATSTPEALDDHAIDAVMTLLERRRP